MKKILLLIAAITIAAQAQTVDLAEGFYLQYKTEFTSFNQWYPQSALFAGQENYSSFFSLSPDLTFQSDWNTDLRIKPRIYYEINDNDLKFEQGQLRGMKRTRAYFEELYLDHYSDDYEWRIGYQTWAFKTVESYSQTDVVNQVDPQIDFFDAPKYGELAARVRWILPTESERVLELTYLPFLQHTRSPVSPSRFDFFAGVPFKLADNQETQHSESLNEWYPRFLLRYSTLWFESMDVNFLGVYGYDRSPHFVIASDTNGIPLRAIARYENSAQLGANFQGAFGPWLVKGEIMAHRYLHSKVPVAQNAETHSTLATADSKIGVGITSGVEYTLYSPIVEGHDLGIIAEGIYHTDTHLDAKEQIRFIPFKNHLFTGLRYVFNTPSDRTLLLGGFLSMKNTEALAQLEYEERLWQIFKIKLRGVFLYGSADSPLKNFKRGRRLDAEISYNF